MTRPLDPETLLASAPWVRRLARRLVRDAHLAEDVAQDALAAALARDEGFDSPARLRRWLAGATRQLAWRVRGRELEQHAREERAAKPEGAGDDVAERLCLHRRLVEAVLGLDEPYREVLVMRFFDELPPREIAQRLGLSNANARQRISRGLAQLRARLDDETPGGRAAWCGALVGLIQGSHASHGTVFTTTVTLMGLKTALTIAAGLLLLLGISWVTGSEPGALDAQDTEVAHVRASGAGESATSSSAEGRTATSSSQVSERRCVVRVTDPEGNDLADAEAWWLGAENPVPLLLDAGVLDQAASSSGATLLARAPGHLPAALTLEVLEGAHVLELAMAASISGSVTVDGELPGESIELEFHSEAEGLDFLEEGLRPAARSLLRVDERKVRTDASGSFRLSEVEEDWVGTVRLPNTHLFRSAPKGGALPSWNFEGDYDFVHLEGPGTYELDLTRLHVLSGRFVWADDGSPAPAVRAQVDATFDHGVDAVPQEFTGDESGRFVVGIRSCLMNEYPEWLHADGRPAVSRVILAWHGPEGLPGRREWSRTDLSAGLELGDIQVERGRQVHFLVRDQVGTPIEGAFAEAGNLSDPSDVDGRGVVRGVSSATDWILFGAPRMRVARVPLGAGATEEAPLEVVLLKGNVLDLRLTDGEGDLPAQARMVLASVDPPFEWGQGEGGYGPSRIHEAIRGAEFQGASWDEDGGSLVVDFDANGRSSIHGLADNVSFDLRLRDNSLNGVLHEESFLGPSGGESLVHEVVFEGKPFTLTGRVIDWGGEPLAQAVVGLNWRQVLTNKDGKFEITGLYPFHREEDLSVVIDGYPSRYVRSLLLSEETDLGEIVLSPARSLVVEVFDEAGDEVEWHLATARAPGYGSAGPEDPMQPGAKEIQGVPSEEVTVKLHLGWDEFIQTVAPGVERVRFVVPVQGKVQLLLPDGFEWPTTGGLVAQFTNLEDPEDVRTEWVRESVRGTAVHEWLPARYQVRLVHRWEVGDEEREEWLPGEWEVEVRSGETTRLVLED